MALIVENGAGIANANSYNTIAFIDAYLATRGRGEENGWDGFAEAEKEPFAVAATDYIENRFSRQFKGVREFCSLKSARSTLTFTQQPADTETITLGTTVYTFNTVLGGANSVLIGASVSVSIDNLINAINAADGEGTVYGTGTVINGEASAEAFEEDTLVAKALIDGTPGNAVATSSTVTGATWTGTTLTGGSDVGRPQLLSFPRLNLLSFDGIEIRGIPTFLKYAHAEYTIRAAAATLNPDPTTDDRGGMVTEKEEVVGPIKERTKYQEGFTFSLIRAYPAADRMLQEYIQSGGMVIR